MCRIGTMELRNIFDFSGIHFPICSIWNVYERHYELKKWKVNFEALQLGSRDVAALYRVFSNVDSDNSKEIDVLSFTIVLYLLSHCTL